jgi:hypothetical protein
MAQSKEVIGAELRKGDRWVETGVLSPGKREEDGGYDELGIQIHNESIRRGTALWQPSVHERETCDRPVLSGFAGNPRPRGIVSAMLSYCTTK